MANETYAKSIELPTEQIFKNLKYAKMFALDIGGSLAKLAYYTTVVKKKSKVQENVSKNNGLYEVLEEDIVCDQLHFIKFESKYMEICIDFIQKNLTLSKEVMKDKHIKVTGGGAFKYKDLLTNKLGLQVDKEDEMACLIKGCNFLLKNIPDEAFLYQRHGNPEYKFQNMDTEAIFPYLLVNIGSGVSILKVESDDKYERIGGTSMGGGTFWGLGSILTKAKGFDELLGLAENGDHRNVDMLVKDIYGGAYELLGLSGDIIASSLGRAARSSFDKDSPNFRDADIVKSLLISISNDIGQIASLNARLHGLKQVIFGGFFIRGHPLTMHTMSYAVNYWSKGEIKALFLQHEGYLGAIGAFLRGLEEEDAESYSWQDFPSWSVNYAGSSGLQSPRDWDTSQYFSNVSSEVNLTTQRHSASFDMLELDRFVKPLMTCPLLKDPASYNPDTVDLTQDEAARTYWLDCFEEATDKYAEQALKSQPSTQDAEQRANNFKLKYKGRLTELKHNPCAFGPLTVRSLLDTREHCLEEFHFVDPFSQQKQQENQAALTLLSDRLKYLKSLDWRDRQFALVEGLLAGNVFDWGAKEVATMMESFQFGFQEALGKLQKPPWLIDDLEAWITRSRAAAHKCALIFIDNSGIDVILGVFPFAIELISRGSKVILCANSQPALNDVTYQELLVLTKQVAVISTEVQQALSQGRLLVMESGQGSPCLDLRYLDFDTARKVQEWQTDLVVLEGMGRAIHTNFNSRFNCDCLKVAVLKNRWLANRFGGDMFSVVFKFEPRDFQGTSEVKNRMDHAHISTPVPEVEDDCPTTSTLDSQAL